MNVSCIFHYCVSWKEVNAVEMFENNAFLRSSGKICMYLVRETFCGMYIEVYMQVYCFLENQHS